MGRAPLSGWFWSLVEFKGVDPQQFKTRGRHISPNEKCLGFVQLIILSGSKTIQNILNSPNGGWAVKCTLMKNVCLNPSGIILKTPARLGAKALRID